MNTLMAQRLAIWYGSDADLQRLRAAVAHNCDCRVPTRNDPAPAICAAHVMLADQDVLNHFVFVAIRRRKFQRAEFNPVDEWWL